MTPGIPIPGGEGWAGMFGMIRTNLQADKGYAPIFHGNSYTNHWLECRWRIDAKRELQPITRADSPPTKI